MKILTLRLERYGPFTNRTLEFNPAAKLHVVYGPNEAGKTSALAAVTDLLFGFDPRSPYDFQHAAKDLRIGATILASDGAELTFRRRKGNKKTLINASEEPLPEDVLSTFLGALTRDVFCGAFGLNAETLRRGADEMLKSEGEVGASLFAAASGLRGLTDLRKQLEAEADAIFAPRASKERSFYLALGRFDEARRAMREQELKGGEWKDLNDTIDELKAQQERIEKQRAEKKIEWAALARLKRVAPQIRLIDQELGKLDALGPLPSVAPGFPIKLSSALDALTLALQQQDRARRDKEAAAEDCASITVDDALLPRADEVAQLFADTGAITKAQQDLPNVQVQLEVLTGEIAHLALRVGITNSGSIQSSRPTDSAQALVRALIAERHLIETKREALADKLADEEGAVEILESQNQNEKRAKDPAPLLERFRALSPVLSKLEIHRQQEAQLQALERSLGEAAQRLSPSVNDIDALATATLPRAETVARFRKDLDDLDRRLDLERGRVADAVQAMGKAQASLDKALAGRPVPSPEAISAERRQRDCSWLPLRTTLLGEKKVLTGPALGTAVSLLERHTAQADRLADDALSERDRVTQHAAQQLQLAETEVKAARANAAVLALQNERQMQVEAWHALWNDTGIAPLHPAEMAAWLDAVHRLLERREELQNLRFVVLANNKEIESVAPALHQLIDDAGLKCPALFTPAAAGVLIENRLRDLTDVWNQARDAETRLADLRQRISKLTDEETKTDTMLANWVERWRSALVPLNLPHDAMPEMASATLDVWREIPAKLTEYSNCKGRADGMHRDIIAFEDSVSVLLSAVAPDLRDLRPIAGLRTLNGRVGEAAEAAARRRDAIKRKSDAEAANMAADVAVVEMEAALGRIAAELPVGSKAAELLDPLAQRERIHSALEGLRQQLIAQSDGLLEPELRNALVDFDPDAAVAKIASLEEDDKELEKEGREAFAEHKRLVEKRTSFEQGVGSELAAFQRSGAEAELLEASHTWATHKLGALLIAAAIERHRAAKQDPLMRRAAQLFALITGGAFDGLDQEIDEKDIPHLIGRRVAGGTVRVPGMSEGTRDQLYLALRLAYLEEFANRSAPIPFIGDDLCTTFDYPRTANAISALADVGNRVQTILFTHHSHVVDLAKQRLGDAVDVVEL